MASCTTPTPEASLPASSPLDRLKNMTGDIQPITPAERLTRIEKAQQLMAENKIQGLYLDAGTSMEYFTGIKWGQSERMLAVIIPAQGKVKYISPAFEAEQSMFFFHVAGDENHP